MAKECEEGVLNWKSPIILSNLGIDLKELAEEDSVKISCYNQCMGNAETRYINIGEYAIIDCYDGSNTKWEVHYVSYINAYKINVEVCEYEEEPAPILCVDHTTQTACENAGCFWYNGTCHTSDEEVLPDDLTDYERIRGDTVDSITPVLTGINLIDQGVDGVKMLINGVSEGLSDGVETITGSITDGINEVKDYLIEQISTLSESLTTGFEGVGDKIDGLKFPTIDSIKGAFLDVCADLAVALWDAILNKIEERYPKDEEESD